MRFKKNRMDLTSTKMPMPFYTLVFSTVTIVLTLDMSIKTHIIYRGLCIDNSIWFRVQFGKNMHE